MPNENLQSSSDKKCLFCRIINGESSAKVVYQDEHCLAFYDIFPKAPVHILIIPLKHIPSVSEMEESDQEIIGHLIWAASKIASQLGINQNGYRLVINTGSGAGQTILHIHVHLLSGRPFSGL